MNERTPEPWHEADGKPTAKPRSGPIGTHSLTGGGASVGMPTGSKDAEPGDGRQQPREEQPDPLAEPRAQGRGILGPKP